MVDLDLIRQRLSDPADVAERLGLRFWRQSSRSALVLCPEHRDKDASCSLSVSKKGELRAKCFACGWSGDIFGLVAAVRGLDRRADFGTVAREAAKLAGVEEAAYARRRHHDQLPDPVAKLAYRISCLADDFLRGAKIADPTIENTPLNVILAALKLLQRGDELEERFAAELEARAKAYEQEDARRFALACAS